MQHKILKHLPVFKKNNIILLLTLFFSVFLEKQILAQKVQVNGRVIDAETEEPLGYANIALLNPADSSVVTGGMSNDGGTFKFAVEPGDYILRAGFIGYVQYFESVAIASTQAFNTGVIALRQDVTALEEITIEGIASMFESDIDKRVYNVENSIIAEGGTASDVLAQLPSIQIDEEGGIAMRGSGNVLIYINGRPTNLSSEETESILSQFPANSIKSIELITNPSSRYDATGVGGIINIILKKEERLGFNGSVNASAGTRHKYTGGLNLNYNTGKFNFFTTYNYQYRELFELSESLRQAKRGNVSPFLDQDFDTRNTYQSHLLRGGIDYDINPGSTLGAYVQYNYRSRDRIRVYHQRHQNENRALDSLFVRTLTEDQYSTNLETGLTYNLELDSLGQTLYASFSYANDYQDRVEYFDQLYFNEQNQEVPENRALQIYSRPQDDDLYILQIDYNKPFQQGGKLEAGWKSTLSQFDRGQGFEQFDLNTDQYVVNDTIADRFTFNEYVHGAYLIYRNSFGKLSYQAGVRGELTLTDSYWYNKDSAYVNNYFNLFPSLYLTYDLGNEEEFQVNYSRRISRPTLRSLAPFYNAQDLLNLRFSNPYLQPGFTDSYEIGYLKGWQKLFFTGTVYHRRSSNIITRVINLLDNNAAVQNWENANRRRSTGLELINQFQFSDHIDATLSGNFFYSEIIGDNIQEGFNNANFSWTVSLLSNIQIPGIATVQLQGDYRGPIVLPQGEIDPIYGLNIGARRDLWNKKATVSVNVSDLFNTKVFKIRTDDANFFQERLFNRETRIATLAFTYRFGNFSEKSSRSSRDEYGDDPF